MPISYAQMSKVKEMATNIISMTGVLGDMDHRLGTDHEDVQALLGHIEAEAENLADLIKKIGLIDKAD